MVVGFGLRLLQPDLVEFKRDEATIARLGQAIAYEGYLPAAGVDSSLGIDNLPLTLYLAALPLRLWSDPLAVVIFTALLNALALVACYLLVRACFGEREALLATLLFAVSPWAVLYARKIWARTLPLVTLAFVASLYLTFVRKKPWALVGAFAALAALLGLQLEALAFVPVLGLALIRYIRDANWKALAAGVLVFACLSAPYVLRDFVHGWENARGLVRYVRGSGVFSWDAVCYTFALVGSQGIEGQAGPFFQQFRDALRPFWWVNGLLSGLLGAGCFYALHQAFRGATEARRRTFALLLLWLIVPVALQLRPSAPTQPHYFVMHYPVQYILIAAVVVAAGDAIRRLSERASRTGRGHVRARRVAVAVAAVALTVACVWQILVTLELRSYMAAHPSTGGYGVPLRYTRAVAQRARSLLSPSSEVVVLGTGTAPFLTEAPTVFDAVLFDVPHRFADGRVALPFPQRDHVVYLLTPDLVAGEQAATTASARLPSLPTVTPAVGVTLPDGPAYRLYVWESPDRTEVLAGMTMLGGGVPFANNVVVAATELPATGRAGAALDVWLVWWVRMGPEPDDVHFTAQLVDDRGCLLAQDDHAGFPSHTWRAGDLVLSRFYLSLPTDLPAGSYQARAGVYTYPDITAVPVVDPEGIPVDDGVTLGTLTVDAGR